MLKVYSFIFSRKKEQYYFVTGRIILGREILIKVGNRIEFLFDGIRSLIQIEM